MPWVGLAFLPASPLFERASHCSGAQDKPARSRLAARNGGPLTGQSLLRAARNSNECNRSRARKKIGPVKGPCDRPIDVFSMPSLIFLVTSRLADQRPHVALQGLPLSEQH